VQGDKYYLAEGAPAFEDGTLDYLNIPAVEIGLKHLQTIGYEVIHERVRCLTGWLLNGLTALKHSTGEPLVRIYGPTTTEGRGRGDDQLLRQTRKPWTIARGKRSEHISISCARAVLQPRCGRGPWHLAELAPALPNPPTSSAVLDDFRVCIDGKSSGAVRISVGMVTNFNDVQAFLTFARGLLG
jgi:selenocysteine lyase/cysteine desulfurase